MEYLDFRQALQKLPPDQREALILIGASGLSYEEAAEICKCAVGTMKSRVSRARTRLAELLQYDPGAGKSQLVLCRLGVKNDAGVTSGF